MSELVLVTFMIDVNLVWIESCKRFLLRTVNKLFSVVDIAKDDVWLVQDLVDFIFKAQFILSRFENEVSIPFVIAAESAFFDENVSELCSRMGFSSLRRHKVSTFKIDNEEVGRVRQHYCILILKYLDLQCRHI